jgi:hypothetical protein
VKGAAGGPVLTDRQLNRATLARQGLLERLPGSVVEVVEAVGAIQAQQWSAVAAGLWARSAQFDAGALYAALGEGSLVTGTLLRRTRHLCSRREHPAYALVADAMGANDWWRSGAPPDRTAVALRRDLLAYAARVPRTVEETTAFIEAWLDERPGVLSPAEVSEQRRYGWRPYRSGSDFLRCPCDGQWGPRTPSGFLAAPVPPSLEVSPDVNAAMDTVVCAHLRAFGPAGADDVAAWTGHKPAPVHAALERLAPSLALFADERGRALFDLPDAPRPDPDTPAPVRMLPWFDGVLLSLAPSRRSRLLSDEHRDVVYSRANLQVRPIFLVDGQVAGTWALTATGRAAVLTLQPFAAVPKSTAGALVAEAEPLVRVLAPTAKDHAVTLAGD